MFLDYEGTQSFVISPEGTNLWQTILAHYRAYHSTPRAIVPRGSETGRADTAR